ncbi:MAG: BRO family protein [Roseburia sp.]
MNSVQQGGDDQILQENNKIQVYDNQPIRTAWDEDNEEWYFSIIDVVAVLTESKDANAYWRKLKQRLIEEGNETVTNCHGLKMKAADGKRRMTDIANTEQLLRIIQSIPSKKAEPFKLWLAQVGRERIEEIIDPELTIDRALETYSKKGYSADWINQRLQTIRARKELTDEWQNHGVQQGREYAILTDEVTKAWSGMNTRQYKNRKGLKKENLRDNMSTLELALNMLAEATTTELTKTQNPQGLEENRAVARTGGQIAGEARERIEKETGNPVITSENAVGLNSVVTEMIQGVVDLEDQNKE